MKFSPIFIIPQQERNTTPDIFLTDQYGKNQAEHGDGKLKIDQAIRLSKIVNRITPAFAENNSIIYGFLLNSVLLKNDDLEFNISDGLGILDKSVFFLNLNIISIWKNFKNIIPKNLQKGRILLYFGYKDSVKNANDRPYKQNVPYNVVNKYPDDQSTFDPVSINTAFYNIKTKRVVNSEWDQYESKILITGSIFYEREINGNVRIWFTDSREEITVVNDDSTIEHLQQQGGGFNFSKLIDGGSILDEVNTDPFGINILINEEIIDENQKFILPYEITDLKNLMIFCNGIKYRYPEDINIEKNQIVTISNKLSLLGKHIFIFQNIDNQELGSLKTIFSDKIVDSTIIEKSEILINNLTSKSKILVFYNGLLLSEDEYELTSGKIKFKSSIKKNIIIEIIEIIESVIRPRNVEIIFSGDIISNGSSFSTFNLNPLKTYLVFYNGILYNSKIDYIVNQNNIIFKNLFLSKNKKIQIIGI